jgi:hypothetical protein
MKWVNIGVAQGVVFVGLAAYADRGNAKPILAGGILAAVLLYAQYAHAKQSGLAKGGPPTESY